MQEKRLQSSDRLFLSLSVPFSNVPFSLFLSLSVPFSNVSFLSQFLFSNVPFSLSLSCHSLLLFLQRKTSTRMTTSREGKNSRNGEAGEKERERKRDRKRDRERERKRVETCSNPHWNVTLRTSKS